MSEAHQCEDPLVFWKSHSEGWRTSGLTQAQYCEREGINYPSFIYQHTKLSKQTKQESVAFIETKPSLVSSHHQSAAGVQLILPNGVRIGVGNEVNALVLQTVLTIAGGLRC